MGVYVRQRFLASNVMHYLRDEPRGIRLASWQSLYAAQRGLLVWVIDREDRPLHPAWRHLALRSGLAVCMPALPGLTILALARRAEDLASSCPADAEDSS
jgi:hypothetical protein